MPLFWADRKKEKGEVRPAAARPGRPDRRERRRREKKGKRKSPMRRPLRNEKPVDKMGGGIEHYLLYRSRSLEKDSMEEEKRLPSILVFGGKGKKRGGRKDPSCRARVTAGYFLRKKGGKEKPFVKAEANIDLRRKKKKKEMRPNRLRSPPRLRTFPQGEKWARKGEPLSLPPPPPIFLGMWKGEGKRGGGKRKGREKEKKLLH